MDRKDKETLISKQERAARQQELLEKKRRAKAEYNASPGDWSATGTQNRGAAPGRRKGKKPLNREIFNHRVSKEESRRTRAILEQKEEYVTATQWFLSVCWLKIPIIGFLYALILSLSRKAPCEKRNFARGYLLYRILVMLLSLAVLYALYRVGLDLVEELLSYVR